MKQIFPALAGLALLLAASPAMTANGDVNVNIGVPGLVAPAPVYVEPRRAIVVQPAPVYVAPRPHHDEREYAWREHEHERGRHEHHDHGRHKGHGHHRD